MTWISLSLYVPLVLTHWYLPYIPKLFEFSLNSILKVILRKYWKKIPRSSYCKEKYIDEISLEESEKD